MPLTVWQSFALALNPTYAYASAYRSKWLLSQSGKYSTLHCLDSSTLYDQYFEVGWVALSTHTYIPLCRVACWLGSGRCLVAVSIVHRAGNYPSLKSTDSYSLSGAYTLDKPPCMPPLFALHSDY